MNLRTSLWLFPLTLTGTLALAGGCGGGEENNEGGKAVKDDKDDKDSSSGGTGSGGSDGEGSGAKSGGGGAGGDSAACADKCTDDGNPCTEDVCNPKTGECGIPRSGNACDDGIYCNGDDVCDAGDCTEHAGNPCSETSCNEGKNACECSQVAHCPGADISAEKHGSSGEWGTIDVGNDCQYDNTCDEACSCSVAKTTYECTAGSCVTTDKNIVDPTCGSRSTTGDSCTDNGVFCDGDEVCSAGTCNSSPATVPTCPGGPAFCYAPLDKCVTCVPGTFKCGAGSGSDEITIECKSNGEWDASSWNASCYASQNEVCDPISGGCKTGYFDPRDADFDVPELIRGISPLERGRKTADVFNLAIESEFG